MGLQVMKILHISPTNEIGGAKRYASELTKAMARTVETTLLIFGDERKTVKTKNLRTEIYPAYKSALNSLAFIPMDPFSLDSIHEIDNFDIIHIHQFRRTISNIAVVYANFKNKPVFVTDHGGVDFFSTIFFSFIAGRLANCFLPVSDFSAQSLLRYGMNSRVIYGGVDVFKFYPRNLEKEPGKVLFVGRLAPQKGCEYLIKAVQDLDVNLSIVSPQSNPKTVERLKLLDKNRRVKFEFGLSDEELVNEYCTSNVTILPSVYMDYYGKFHAIPELLGLTLLESMACGTPVICTNVGGMPEIVKDGKTGFMVNPNDVKGLRDGIEYFMNNPKQVRIFGERGRNQVLESYTWDSVARRCLSFYKDFL